MFSEIQVFKCFLCTCAANDAGCEATGGPPQELGAKQLAYYIGEHNDMKTELYGTNGKSQSLVPAHFALIINLQRACAQRGLL